MEPIVFKYEVLGGGPVSVHSDGSVTGVDYKPNKYLTCVENNLQMIIADKLARNQETLAYAIDLSIQKNISLPEATEQVLQAIDKINS